MRQLVTACLSLWLVLILGCLKNEDNNPPSASNVHQLWPRGTSPVPSPADGRVLFVQEEPPAGLYVLQDDNATALNPSGPEARTDYTWSPDAQRIAFSSPGEPGSADAGIWISEQGSLSSLNRIWDRGSHPRFFPIESLLVCSGPEDGSQDQGIWQMNFSGEQRSRLAASGVDPEISPDDTKIAYLLTTGGSSGRTMVVYDRSTSVLDTVAVNVLGHQWLSDSRTLIYETVRVQNNGEEIAEVHLVGPNDDLLGINVAAGTAPSAMRDNAGFFFTAVSNYRASGIYLGSITQSPSLISEYGTNAHDAGGHRVVAQDSTTLIEITF